MKKLLSVISVIILVLVGVNFLLPTVSAQMVDRNADLVQTTLEELVKTNSLPTLLEIKDISPAKSTYTQGEGVAGTFVIKNTHDYNIPDLKYQISLVGGYGVDGLAREIYDSRFYGPIFLRSGETKEINFGYLLPSNVAGSNLGLRIRLYTSTGLPLVWKDKPLEVTGGNSMMKISDAYLNVGNTKYSVSAGPTLSVTKKAVINVKLENPFNQERTLTPEIKIYSGSAMGAVLKTTTLKPFTISAKGTKSFSSEISYFDKPGIYEVAVNFYNSQKVKVAPTTLAKYVVSGPMAVIQQITLDKNTLKSGKDFNFKMAYTGIPKDIDQPSVHKENILNVLVTILNEEAFLVASYNSKIDFNKGTVLEVPLTAKETAKKVFVNVVVTDALGNKITAYNQEITGNPTSNNFPGVLWLIGLVFLLAIIIISVFYRKNKVLKAFLFIGIFCYSIFSAGTAMAYQGALPEIYVSNVKLEKDIYNPGDTVKGTFLLKNYDPVVAPDIYYEIKLAGDYKNTLAKIFYDHSEMIGPLILAGKENKTIAFEYKLPENLAGKGFGIQVQSMLKTGTGMGWSDGFFDITGTSSFIKAEANISTSASTVKTYFLQQGPMVYKGEKAYVNMEFSNNHNLGQDVYPKLTIYDRSEARGILLTKEESVIKVPAAGVTKNRIELPVFNYVPGVYVGKLEFFDKAGAQVSNTLDFRYIVFGQMVTINNVISDKEYAYKDDTINLSVDVTGAPLDINDLSISASSTGSIAIKLFNENNVLVGESVEADIDFNANDIKVYPIQITEKAKTLKAEVKAISPTGEPLGELTVNLTKSPMPGFTLLGLLKIKAFAYALVVVIILLVLFGIRFSIKKKNKLALVLFFVAILIVISWIGIIRTERADAFVSVVKSQHRYTFTFYLNYPNPGDTFIPGQKVTVQAQAKYHACDNVADSAHLTLANNGLSNNPITVYSANSSFSIPNFQLSSTPWENNLDFKFVWDYAPTENYEIGYQPYIIQPVISAVTSPNCGGKVFLSWVADLEPDLNYYKIYNKGVLLATSTTNSIDVVVPGGSNSLTWSSYYTTTMGGRQLGVVTRFNERTPLNPRTISWRSVTGALSYDIKVYNKPGVPNGTVMVSGLTGTSYTFTDANSAPYRFIIQTITAPVSTESGKSKAVQAVPSSACAYPPLAGSCTSGISYDEEYSDPLLITWGVVSTGGSGIYRYVWNGDSSLSNSSLTINPSMDNGTFDAKVVIYDYNDMSKSVTISCPTVVIGPCTGSIPAGSTACSDTLQDREGAWTPVSSCSVPAGQCEYHAIATTTLSAVTSPDCGGNVSLSWTAVPEATLGYRIYRSTGGGSPVLFASTAATSYMASSTVGDTFTVRTVIAGQVESLSSNSVSATPSAPCAPLNLTATAATEPGQCGGYTTLSWTAVPGVDGYHVYRGTETTPLITTTATSTTLLASFTDYFMVKTYLGTQESEPSNSVKGVPSAPCAPPDLTATAATEPSQCGGYTTLRWGEVPGVTGYHVYHGTTLATITTLATTTTATSTTIKASASDFFVVRTYVGTQESEPSNFVKGVPSAPCPVGVCSDPLVLNTCVAPGTFANMEDTVDASYWICNGPYGGASTTCSLPYPVLTVNKIGSGTGLVTSTSTAPTTPVINCGSDCTSANAPVLPGSSITLTATPTFGHVFAGWNGGGCSEKDITCTFDMSTTTIIEAKFNIVPPGSLITEAGQCGGFVTLKWGSVSGVDGYYVYKGTETTPFITTIDTSAIFTAVAIESYMVKTYLGDQKSDSTNNVVVEPSAPCAPPDLTATAATEPSQCGGYTTLSWTAVPGITGYHVYNGTTRIATTTATSTTILALVTDYFTVKAYLGTQESSASNGVYGAPSDPCNPICGSVADGVRPVGTDRSTPPGTAEEKCEFGIAGPVTGDPTGPWNWTCTDVTSSVACTVTPPPVPPSAYCGTFNATTTAIAPSTNEEKCRVGIPSDITGGIDAPWIWTCSSAGYVSSCSTNLPVALLSASCSVSPSTAAIGETTTWTATPTGGVGDYTYNWVGPNLTGKDTIIATTSYSEVGDYYGQVTVTDQDASEYTVSCDNHVAITPDPTVSCSGTRYYDDPLNIPSGKISWLATSYNAGNPNYSWNNGLSTTSATLLQDIVSGVTRYVATIKVTDLANNKTATSSCEIHTNGVDGSCGVPKDTCLTGDFVDVTDEGATYKWNCNGKNGGLDTQCSACMDTPTEPADTYCGTANGTTRTTPPSTDAEKCSAGMAGVVAGGSTGPWTWSCNNDCYVSSCSASTVVVPQTATLSVNRVGPGIVSDATGMIICGPAATYCAVTLPVGTPITLTATPESGATFQGWSGGGCTGTGVCSVTLNVDTTINGTFTSPVTSPSCGTANGTTRTTPPSTDAEKCSIGTSSSISENADGSWGWNCVNQDDEVSCSAIKSGAFTVSCTVSPDIALTGDTVTWVATSTGGVGAYTYSWAGTNLAGKHTAIATTSYTTEGTYYGIATVKRGEETLSANCTNSIGEAHIIVRNHLAASCSVSPTSTTTGQTVTWTATSTGGVGAYTYSWAGTNLTGKNTAIVTTSYSGVGTYTATATIRRGAETISVGCGTGITIGDGTCSDQIMNGNETSIDLGGRCGTCSDGIKNGNETGVDSGGRCGTSSCSDGQKNGDETGVDCGGSCPACDNPCTSNCGGNLDVGNYCDAILNQCIDGATALPVDTGHWTCTKTNGDEIQVSYCSATVSESLSCTLSLTSPSLQPINRGSNSIWTVTPYPSGTYTYNWYIKNSNNTVTSTKPYGTSIPVADHGLPTLEYVLRTLGANTVTVKVSSGSRVAYCSNIPSVSVVASGGSNLEF